jgi:hypothetical protein
LIPQKTSPLLHQSWIFGSTTCCFNLETCYLSPKRSSRARMVSFSKAQDGPRRPQKEPRKAQEGSKKSPSSLQEGPRRFQEVPRMSPERRKTPLVEPRWLHNSIMAQESPRIRRPWTSIPRSLVHPNGMGGARRKVTTAYGPQQASEMVRR